MGNAWFVDDVTFVDTPDDESAELWKLDLGRQAVADKRFAEVLTAHSEGSGRIVMTEYKPNKLAYQSASDADKVAVFSEIYYPHGWHLYVDDREVALGRVNYTLRAALIPAGNHQLRMEFVPDALRIDKLSLTIMLLSIVLSLGCVVLALVKR